MERHSAHTQQRVKLSTQWARGAMPGPPGRTRSRSARPRGAWMQDALDGITAMEEWSSNLEARDRELREERRNMAEQYALLVDLRTQLRQEKSTHDASAYQLGKDIEANRRREAELREAQAKFDRQQADLMADYVSPEDIITINMGGEKTDVQVKRSLLTQFDKTMLGVMFSGRWDKQISRDSKGAVFFDHPPDVMMPIIEWLRACRDSRTGLAEHPPNVKAKVRIPWIMLMMALDFQPAQLLSAGIRLEELWNHGMAATQLESMPSVREHFFIEAERVNSRSSLLIEVYKCIRRNFACVVIFCNQKECALGLANEMWQHGLTEVQAVWKGMPESEKAEAMNKILFQEHDVVTTDCVDLRDRPFEQQQRTALLHYGVLDGSTSIYLHRLDACVTAQHHASTSIGHVTLQSERPLLQRIGEELSSVISEWDHAFVGWQD